MPPSAPSGRASERVHEHLRREILDGRLAPGDPVPSERALAEEHGVNRHAVREALKRLEQAGLVRISQGGATRVLDWRDSGGLEVLLDLVGGSSAPVPLELARSVLEMRESIGVDAARRCATRAPGATRASIRALSETAATAIGSDPAAVDQAYEALWRMIVEGSQNIAYRLALNSLLAAVGDYEDIAAVMRPADPDVVRSLGTAIESGDAAGAGDAAERLLGSGADELGG
jgi:DNA-binding FadR family transcriptional regulator